MAVGAGLHCHAVSSHPTAATPQQAGGGVMPGGEVKAEQCCGADTWHLWAPLLPLLGVLTFFCLF